MKYSGIGGQAVIEGVMMKNKQKCAVAVRRSDGELEVRKQGCKDFKGRHKIGEVPVIRGIATFAESISIGMNALNFSASLYEEAEGQAGKGDVPEQKNGKKESLLMGLVLVLAVIIAIAVFVIFPFLVSESMRKMIRSAQLRGLIEGVIRVILFVVYVKLISLMEDVKRVFMYHGAEHKSINCIENGYELTVENVRKQSTQHKRCGTSFLLIVMFISILFFMFISVRQMWLRMIFRILLIPVIAGVAYEFIRYAGSHDNVISNLLSKPGLWLQGLTTAEPDDLMIEVAIASVEAVFDWKKFVAEIREEKFMSEQGAIVIAELSESEESEETGLEEAEKRKAEKAAETAAAEESGIEILTIDDDEDEDDEILSALDRYFEAPK